ncbi:zf-HC2 domain-containing protein [Herbivorax sp. ANBcel31]|uniref:anti-sigma factor family protein n=1 Tax=Herbivorax sp. ANBcel31 TaxID=3069754 RepID=UPI0027AE5401|nr:zf-HC2 domain-containing protein [Herbivorax sp. ANBcel31]MDQ2085268.1 zf-HC2 domain-containing protein [Herbivorax sp. ANBcel31]
MKDCKEIMELISGYIDDQLNETEKSKFENHIRLCDKCSEELREQMEVVSLCNDIDDVEPPKEFNKQLHNKLLKEKQKKFPLFHVSSKHIKLVSSIAAAFLLIFVTTQFLTRDDYINNMEPGKEHEDSISSEAGMLESKEYSDGIYAEDSESANLFSFDTEDAEAKIYGKDQVDSGALREDIDGDFGGIEDGPDEGIGDTSDEGIDDVPDGGIDDVPDEGIEDVPDEVIDDTSGQGIDDVPDEDEELEFSAETEEIGVKVFVINRFSNEEDTEYVIDTANKIGIEIIAENGYRGSNQETTTAMNDTVSIKFETEKNKYDRFIRELEIKYTDITINKIVDEETEKTVEVIIE